MAKRKTFAELEFEANQKEIERLKFENTALRRIKELGRYSHDDIKNTMKPNWSGEFVRYDDICKLFDTVLTTV